MTKEERNIKLKHLITCMKCEVSGKVCDENCPTQYAAGNMGEIIENLEAISKILDQQPCEDTAHWIDEADKIDAQYGRHTYKCSKCGKYAEYFVSGTEVWWDRIKPNFCPNCGAKMQEVEK